MWRLAAAAAAAAAAGNAPQVNISIVAAGAGRRGANLKGGPAGGGARARPDGADDGALEGDGHGQLQHGGEDGPERSETEVERDAVVPREPVPAAAKS